MFGKRNKRIVELDHGEVGLMITALLNYRNKVVRAGKPTEDLDQLISLLIR